MRIIVAIIMVCCMSTSFAMRCTNEGGNYIIQTGDDIFDVAFKCGQPDAKYEPGLLLDTEVWVYRQSGGAVYRVTFLQGQVSEIDFSRMN